MGLENNPREHDDTIFATVLADGKIHVNVKEGTEGAVLREYATEADKKSGNDKKGKLSGKKWEHVYTELSGHIQKIDFHEGDYGVNLLVVVGEEGDEKPVTLALSTESNFGEDMMKKLPNINLKKPVVLAPFSFENDKGKKQRGISISQDGEKITNFYYDAEEKEVTNGYPMPPAAKKGKVITKSEWRRYFSDAREFLIEDVRERFKIVEKVEGETAAETKARKKANKDF